MALSLCLTKVLLLNSNSLLIGPNLPINLSSHKMVTTPANLEKWNTTRYHQRKTNFILEKKTLTENY